MTTNEFLQKLAEDVLMESHEEVKPSSELEEFVGWDSIARISLIALMDKEFDYILEEDELKKLTHISDIFLLVKDKLE